MGNRKLYTITITKLPDGKARADYDENFPFVFYPAFGGDPLDERSYLFSPIPGRREEEYKNCRVKFVFQ